MSFGKTMYQMLIAGSQAYAKCCAEAYDAHEMLGGKSAYAPAFYTTTIFLASIAVGLAAGLITGCIGAGGGFIITPALMAAGVKGILAVGTDLFHIFAKAIMGTTIHKKLGNVSVKLALAFLVGSICGTFIGGFINKSLYDYSPLVSDIFISTIYALLLGFLGFYALFDFLRATRGVKVESSSKKVSANAGMTGLSVKLRPPHLRLDYRLRRYLRRHARCHHGCRRRLRYLPHVRVRLRCLFHDHRRH